MNAGEWGALMDGEPEVPVDAKPPAQCQRCGKPCGCGSLPAAYQSIERRPDLESRADIRDVLRQLEPPPKSAYRRTRRLSEEERDHLHTLAQGQPREDRPRILGR